MASINQKLDVLYAKISGLSKRQEEYSEEINRLKKEIDIIKSEAAGGSVEEVISQPIQPIEELPKSIPSEESVPQRVMREEVQPDLIPDPSRETINSIHKATHNSRENSTTQMEKFIGENLANKIGVIILILGVAIGTKYSIEHNLITPTWRIVIGYILSGVLGFFAFRLKPKYNNLSAVLASGSIASFYLVSYSAFAFFHFFPQTVAFLLLVLSTVLSAYVAIIYNRQVIAQLGLVGAYAAPFLVSTGSNNVLVLFSYIAIINIAIVYLAKKQEWEELMYSAFLFTSLIFAFWFLSDGSNPNYVTYSLVFSTVFFLQFQVYFLFLSKAKNPNQLVLDALALLCNLFLFYGFVYTILEEYFKQPELKGIFTFGFGALLLANSYYLSKKNESDTKLSFLVAGLGVAFFVIAIAIQFEGNAIPLLWAAWGGALFIYGRIRDREWSEMFSVPVLAIAILGFLSNTVSQYAILSYDGAEMVFNSVFNFNFFTNILFIGIFAALLEVNRKFLYFGKSDYLITINESLKFLIPSAVIFLIYYSVNLEISYFWEKGDWLARRTEITDVNYVTYFPSRHLTTIWQLLWGIFYVFVLAILNHTIWKNSVFRHVNLVLGAFATLMILTMGLYTLSEIRAEYLHLPGREVNYTVGSVYGLRYLTLVLVLSYWYFISRLLKKEAFNSNLRMPIEIGIHVILLWILCSEILHWMDINGLRSAYKASMSITSGCYALLLVGLGIMQQKQHLRIMAIILFGVILVKLFIYDISSMNKLTKTIVFICLGGLLLFISYLYNKYKSKTEKATEEDLPLE